MKALALLSGGLDSILSAKVVKDLGVEVIGLNFVIPFSHKNKNGLVDIAEQARNIGIELIKINLGEEFLQIVRKPRHGYGANVNPCIDCKILMFKKAKELMPEQGASFLISGEVLGQRPMSQNRKSLKLIEQEAGVEGILLRSLCAKLMPETLPEQKRWVERNKLYAFNGRSRNAQFELAEKLGIKEYQGPAGGCLLTDPEFGKRLRDLKKHSGLDMDSVKLLKYGRHFRLSSEVKLVVARNEEECVELTRLAQAGDYIFYPDAETAGPTAMLRGKIELVQIQLSSDIICRYFDLKNSNSSAIIYRIIPQPEEKIIQATK
ncbi:MAG: tRNA 4-thiouridine(8) synthase ThiI, partial [Candidatus Omnitrophota bacterium]